MGRKVKTLADQLKGHKEVFLTTKNAFDKAMSSFERTSSTSQADKLGMLEREIDGSGTLLQSEVNGKANSYVFSNSDLERILSNF